MRSPAVLLLIPLMSCSLPEPRPPASEFLVADGNVTFWVKTGPKGIQFRSSPIVVTQTGSQFYAVSFHPVVRSYSDAVFMREYAVRRNLVTGDSSVILTDRAAARMERNWLSENPDASLVLPDEEPDSDIRLAVTGTTDVVGMLGPFMLYEQRLSVEDEHEERSDSRRGVVDIRTGAEASMQQVLEDSAVLSAIDAKTRVPKPLKWVRASAEIVARRNEAESETELVLRSKLGREWTIGYVDSPVPQLFWLDAPNIDVRVRTALSEAFDGALADLGDVQLVSDQSRRSNGHMSLVAHRGANAAAQGDVGRNH